MNWQFHLGLGLTSWSLVQYLGFLTTYQSTRFGAWGVILLLYLAAACLGYANWCGYFNKGRNTDREMLMAAFAPSIILAIAVTVSVGFGIYAGSN